MTTIIIRDIKDDKELVAFKMKKDLFRISDQIKIAHPNKEETTCVLKTRRAVGKTVTYKAMTLTIKGNENN